MSFDLITLAGQVAQIMRSLSPGGQTRILPLMTSLYWKISSSLLIGCLIWTAFVSPADLKCATQLDDHSLHVCFHEMDSDVTESLRYVMMIKRMRSNHQEQLVK